MKLAISLLTCGRMDLTEQTIKPLIAAAREQKLHLFVVDGSTKQPDIERLWYLAYPTATIANNVRGGAGAAIVYALTEMLDHVENYTHVGLLENDVLLGDGWLAALGLFDRAVDYQLPVGAVSPRCYEDRVLIQRDGFAVMHNLGAGCIIFTREAARIVLDHFRTGMTTDNRRIFAQLSGIDIGSYWAFRLNEHPLTADWHWDATLAAHGLASLALTPSPTEMIGQNPPLAEQGLEIAAGEVAQFQNDKAFEVYKNRLEDVNTGLLQTGVETQFQFDPNTSLWTIFPHQLHMIGGSYAGDWRLKETRGWGTFGWEAGGPGDYKIVSGAHLKSTNAEATIPAFGSIAVLASGGKTGGKIEVKDELSGWSATPDLPSEEKGILQLVVPGGMAYRNIRVTALTPGIVFLGIQSREKQPFIPNATFDYSNLVKP